MRILLPKVGDLIRVNGFKNPLVVKDISETVLSIGNCHDRLSNFCTYILNGHYEIIKDL